MVGSRAPLRQGRRSVRVAGALALLLLGSSARADRADQRAADLYTEGVRLIRAGKYREGAARINAALARGATEPVEAQGSETRFLARPYDPYYWLGVAFMETGQDDKALLSFEKSEVYGVLKRWPDDHEDLVRRRALLEARTPAPEGEPPPAPVCVSRDAERRGRSCLSILVEAFSSRGPATPGQEAYVEGELAFLGGDPATAADRFRRAIAEDPVEALERFRYKGLNTEDYLPRFYLGLALAALGQSEAARAELAESERQVTSLHRPAVRRVLTKAQKSLGGAAKAP